MKRHICGLTAATLVDQKPPKPKAAAVRCMFWTAQATAWISSSSGIFSISWRFIPIAITTGASKAFLLIPSYLFGLNSSGVVIACR